MPKLHNASALAKIAGIRAVERTGGRRAAVRAVDRPGEVEATAVSTAIVEGLGKTAAQVCFCRTENDRRAVVFRQQGTEFWDGIFRLILSCVEEAQCEDP
ncbi:hypothetical protein LWP59_38925 [Amycolatopsis acidiphila]|uniref:Uncharacterized protein n=1 Tax=Amycolatopsis acidiphila TaxID=715473 RepID=A0A558AGN9_9PSEU|nr:hypothetical protein [Amycolatopsis acidiphila]TVT23438.1 hypothetical protein FNH06_09555 [Amycolatopsis acidiphila]UIJ59888.1 hypothetical protein LWP59_38925 [Amycolatopsis acidiphila]GHG62634.1 hypothetical protein GCM10017788_18340 [Amycolatopsis acidiphila]